MVPMSSAIYWIKNIVNNKVYIGQGVDVDRRLKRHKSKLNAGTHENTYLQRSYNKYGSQSFIFEVIEICSIEELDDKERHWIKKMDSMNRAKGFNMESGGNAGKIFSPDRIAKITGKGNPMYGRKHSKEFVQKITLLNRGFSDKLTEKDAEYIKVHILKGVSQATLANRFDVTLATINKIVKGHNWYWVREDLNNRLFSYVEEKRSERDQQIKKLWSEGYSLTEIRRELSCDSKVVAKVLKEELEKQKAEKEQFEHAIKQAYLNKMSKKQIKETFDIGEKAYQRITSPLFHQKKQEMVKRVHELKQQGFLIKQIASTLNIHRETVREYLKKEVH